MNHAQNFYEWLLQSDFAEIGVARPHYFQLDGETVELEVVDLDKGSVSNRQRFRQFLLEVIAQEASSMLQHLGESPSPEKYQHCTYKLKRLQQLRLGIEDKSYQFLQRA
ncbi:MAG: hypothetical protein R3A44_35325 [Caldilineaceae bacterium]